MKKSMKKEKIYNEPLFPQGPEKAAKDFVSFFDKDVKLLVQIKEILNETSSKKFYSVKYDGKNMYAIYFKDKFCQRVITRELANNLCAYLEVGFREGVIHGLQSIISLIK